MKIVVCDDDAIVRAVVRDLVADQGHDLIAETDRGFDAVELVRRFEPDVLVLDLSLNVGRGQDVLEAVRDEPCATVVFTAFAEDPRPLLALGATDVVNKPDFDLLERVLAGLAQRSAPKADRRQPVDRPLPPPAARDPEGADSPADFFATLGDARPGDTLLQVVPVGGDVSDLCPVVRQVVRVQDRLLARQDQLLVLLVGGMAGAGPSVTARITDAWAAGGPGRDLMVRHLLLDDVTPPSDAYFQLLDTV